jgi:adenylate cyclase
VKNAPRRFYLFGLKEPGRIVLPLICVLSFLLLAYLRSGGHLQSVSLAIYDLYLRLSPQSSPGNAASRVVLVLISDDDINRLGEWPISDGTLANALARLQAAEPRVIGLDVYRDRPVPPGSGALKNLLLHNPEIVMMYKFGVGGSVTIPAPAFIKAGERTGFNDVVLDTDGVVRRGLLYMDSGTEPASSFALALALAYLRKDHITPLPGEPDAADLRLAHTTLPPLEADDGPYAIADAAGYQLLLDYRGGESPFPNFSLTDLLQGRIPDTGLRDKVVIVGVAAESVKDYFFTPFSQGIGHRTGMPGVIIHAHLADQLMRAGLDDIAPLRSFDKRVEYGWLLLWCIAGTLVALIARSTSRFVLIVTAGPVLLLATGYVSFSSGYWTPVATPAAGWLMTAILGTAFVSGNERSQRRLLMQLFSRHVSDDVAEELWRCRGEFVREGRIVPRAMTITVMFTDIEGFTTISEARAPEELMGWLNGYMEDMANVVMEHGGVVDDFYGDAIKANFGVPLGSTEPDAIRREAINAVQCALHMNRALAAVNERCDRNNLPRIRVRVGICTGSVVAGCLGSTRRMKYTTLGDTVNIAARLESTEAPGLSGRDTDDDCRILIAQSTWDLVSDWLVAEPVGALSLKGKKEAVTVYRVETRPGKVNHEN